MILTMGDQGIIVVPVLTGAHPILISIGWDFALMIPFVKKLMQRKLAKQIDDFVEWNKKFTSTAYYIHHVTLYEFMQATSHRDAHFITPEHINEYCNSLNTKYQYLKAKRTLEMFILYHKRLIIRPQNATLRKLMKHSGGRRLEIERIRQVKRLRQEGINGTIPSFPSIARMLKINVSLAHRWAHYPDDKLLKKELEYLKTEVK
jgi:hypothetical protein